MIGQAKLHGGSDAQGFVDTAEIVVSGIEPNGGEDSTGNGILVPHPRRSQATEQPLGAKERVPTRLYDGYGEFVADLYKGMDEKQLFM